VSWKLGVTDKGMWNRFINLTESKTNVEGITLKLPFNVNGEVAKELLSTAWWFKTATHRVLSLAKQRQNLPESRVDWVRTYRHVAYKIIPNRRYADSAIILVMSIYKSCKALGIDFRRVELGDWLMFQQYEFENQRSSIALKPNFEFHIATVRYDGTISKVVVKPSIPDNYVKLLGVILSKNVRYMGRVVIKDYSARDSQLWVHGEVQVTIPLDVYYKYMINHKHNPGRYFGGVDVNADRINLVITDSNGKLIDHKTFWFSEVTARGFPRQKAWSIIGTRVHEMLDYAYHHGVKTLYLENPEVLGRLRLLWVKNGDRWNKYFNYKVSIFRSSIIEKVAMKAPLYSIRVGYVSPRGTTNSKKHDRVMRRYGFDRHTASAYLIVLRGLGLY
jgi:hypothetical protein